MANFQYKVGGGSWTDVPSYAIHGTYAGTVELLFPEAAERDGLGRACAAIGKPWLHYKSGLLTASGMSFWNSFFSSSTATSASLAIKAYNSRSASSGSGAWWSCSGYMARPKWGRSQPIDTAACSRTWFYDVEFVIENLEDAS